MGRTYVAQTGSDEFFDVNFSGVDVLGRLHTEVDAPRKQIYPNEDYYSTPYSASKEVAEECARKIRNADDNAFTTVIEEFRGSLIREDETLEEFKEWAMKWATWLKQSGGYMIQ